MSNYVIQNDPNLKYYVRFEYMGNGESHSIHRDDHEKKDDNYYWLDENKGDRNTFLLMPAQQDSTGQNWYYVFTTSNDSNDCWEIGDDEHDKLHDHKFTGDDDQKFCFEDIGNGEIRIRNKNSNMTLYRSDSTYESHHPIMQDKTTNDKHRFKLIMNKDKPVYIPEIASPNPNATQDNLYKDTLIGPIPNPSYYNESPPAPPKVYIGETLLPFYNVSSDPDCTGGDLRDWQVKNRPYYRFRREQQMVNFRTYNVQPPAKETKIVEFSCGMEKSETDEYTKTTGFQLGYTHSKEAGLEYAGASAKKSSGFSMQWQSELVTTVSETLAYTDNLKYTDTLEIDPEVPTTYIQWQVDDIWTLFFDDFKNRKNNDQSSLSWASVGCTLLNSSGSFPKN